MIAPLLFVLLLGIAGSAPAAARDAVLAPGQPLTEQLVVDLVDLALAEEMQGRLRIEIEQPALPLNNRSTAATHISVRDLARSSRGGRFRGVIQGFTGDGTSFALPLAGRAVELIELPVLTRRVGRGELIEPEDVTWLEVPAGRVRADAILDAGVVAGSEARRPLRPGHTLSTRDLGPPLLVRRGKPVRLIYRLGGLSITTLGMAQEDGAHGAFVRVTNLESRRQVQGLVTGPDRVSVGIDVGDQP